MNEMPPQRAIIVGAGPAGLTAAYELLLRTNIKPIIIEKSSEVGGISKTINYKGNRIDIGGHRFFSKSDRVMAWWLQIMALEDNIDESVVLQYHNKTKDLKPGSFQKPPSGNKDLVMLIRKRVSRIYFLKKFFSYPITFSWDTASKLGLSRITAIIFSYLASKAAPRKEQSLEDFFINRFGKKLYHTFFKAYTEKVWGIACNKIPAEWGAQRIKELSITKALLNAIKLKLGTGKLNDLAQKNTTTSLIEQFLYPKLGPGQLWEEVARRIIAMGGEIHFDLDVAKIEWEHQQIHSVIAVTKAKETVHYSGDLFFSTMPVKDLIAAMGNMVPKPVASVASQLQYRDFITVGLLVNRMNTGTESRLFQDNWIYIQEKDVRVGRLQIFNNWSPHMVLDPNTVWLGLEYFCNQGDDIWQMDDDALIKMAVGEMCSMQLIKAVDVIDHTVIRVEKTYPAYFGAYDQFPLVRKFVDTFDNLFLIGRNGMHKYNNADHSMLTAMTAVDNIIAGIREKESIWNINTEQDYQEEQA